MKLIDADRLARWAKNISGNTGAITFDDLNQYLIEAPDEAPAREFTLAEIQQHLYNK